jgi:hypothetical protein
MYSSSALSSVFAQHNSPEPPYCLLLPAVLGEEACNVLECLQRWFLLLSLLLLLLIFFLVFCSNQANSVADQARPEPGCTLLAALVLHPAQQSDIWLVKLCAPQPAQRVSREHAKSIYSLLYQFLYRQHNLL